MEAMQRKAHSRISWRVLKAESTASCAAGERCVLLVVINTLVIAYPREQWFKLL